ncbi:MAG: hypothetical protein LBD40_00860 [Puniceicoccales bacterium]|jgi:hypothetical protein|nr:hypothetical protein [Puniceicoccales bacterium]
MKHKIRNISLLCALLSLSAGSAVAEPGPILSPDGTSFQLNFPPVIVEKLSEFIDSVAGHEDYGAFLYPIEPSSNGPLCKEVGICTSFRTMAEAMMPYFNISQEERQNRISDCNLASLAKTLLKLNKEKITFPLSSVTYMQVVLNYFLDLFDSSITSSIGGCPSTCISTTCWKRLVALKNGISLDSSIEGYKDALGEIALLALKRKFGR